MNATPTPMNIVVSLLGMDAQLNTIAQGAALLAFSDAIVRTLNNLEGALKGELASGVELLVLAHPDELDVTNAVAATDTTGLCRWAVVVLGTIPAVEGVEIVALEEWSKPLLTRVFRSVVAQHRLRRENERLRGDLQTIAYRIRHDLRTLLGGILTTGEAMQEMLMEHDPSSAVLTKPLFHSVDDLEKLIERVCMLTKATANPVPKESVAMGEVLWAVLQRQQRQILKKNAVVTQPDSWPEVAAVSSWLEVVWGNLVSNALQHGKAIPRIELGWCQNEREFRFWVSDNGDGVPPEKVGTLFQPFHWLHHANARKGLGLSIVQRLLELQGGRCGYEPSSEGGSTFFFTLPVEERANASLSPTAIPDQNLRRAMPA